MRSKELKTDQLIGRNVKIIGNLAGHRFLIGTKVTILRTDRSHEIYGRRLICEQGDSGSTNVVYEADIELVPTSRKELEEMKASIIKEMGEIDDQIAYLDETGSDIYSDIGYGVYKFEELYKTDKAKARDTLVELFKRT